MRNQQTLQNRATYPDKYHQLYIEFIERASHDLKSPLRKLEVFTEKLLQAADEPGAENKKVYRERINAALSQMKSLIDDFTQLALSFQSNMKFTEVNTGVLMRKAFSEAGLTLAEPKPEIEMEELPVICGDESQLITLFRKIFENSLKFKSPYKDLKIKISAQKLNPGERERLKLQEGDYYKFCIADNGIGFDDAERKKIFEPLVRLHGKSQYAGNGLGLALVTTIAVNHGGTVFAEGSRSEGARIYIVLPENQE